MGNSSHLIIGVGGSAMSNGVIKTSKLSVTKQVGFALFSNLTKNSSVGFVMVYGFGKTGAPLSASAWEP